MPSFLDAILSGEATFGGDLSGDADEQTVVGVQGVGVAATAPTDGQVLTYDAATEHWRPAASSAAFVAAGDLDGSSTSQVVVGLQENPVSDAAPAAGDLLTWSGSEWEPQSGTAVPFDDGDQPGSRSTLWEDSRIRYTAASGNHFETVEVGTDKNGVDHFALFPASVFVDVELSQYIYGTQLFTSRTTMTLTLHHESGPPESLVNLGSSTPVELWGTDPSLGYVPGANKHTIQIAWVVPAAGLTFWVLTCKIRVNEMAGVVM